MNTAYCNYCREFVTTFTVSEVTFCEQCHSEYITQADEAIDAAEHRMGRRGEDA